MFIKISLPSLKRFVQTDGNESSKQIGVENFKNEIGFS